MSRILTPKGWRELEEITEHKANKPHKHPHKPYGPFEKEEVEESEDNPANRQHLCAKNVVHEEYGEGQCISEQHAEPDRYGHVAWYDVMFEHGIEERLPVNEVKVTKAEDHVHSSKKMKKKVAEETDLREDLLGKHGQHRDDHQKKADHYAGVAKKHAAGGDNKAATNANALSKAHGNAAMAHAKVIDQHKTGDRMKAANQSRPAFKIGQAAHDKEKSMQSDSRV